MNWNIISLIFAGCINGVAQYKDTIEKMEQCKYAIQISRSKSFHTHTIYIYIYIFRVYINQ